MACGSTAAPGGSGRSSRSEQLRRNFDDLARCLTRICAAGERSAGEGRRRAGPTEVIDQRVRVRGGSCRRRPSKRRRPIASSQRAFGRLISGGNQASSTLGHARMVLI